MRCGAARSWGAEPRRRVAPGERGRRGKKARVPPHDDIDLDAAEARIVEPVSHQRERHVARGRGEAGRVVVLDKVVVDGFRHMEAAQFVGGGRRLFAHDAAGIGGVVAADIEEIADVVPPAAIEDLLAIDLVRLVAGRAERGRGRAGDGLQLRPVEGGQIEEPVGGRLDEPAHAMPHAEDAADFA